MSDYEAVQRAIDERSLEVQGRLRDLVENAGRLVVVKAPPGSGKTWLLVRTIADTCQRRRFAVACQTNAQADDVCRRLIEANARSPIVRFVGSGGTAEVPAAVAIIDATRDLPCGPCIVVATTAKWNMVNLPDAY